MGMARADGSRCRLETVVVQSSPFGVPASGGRVARRTGNALQQRRLLTPGAWQTPCARLEPAAGQLAVAVMATVGAYKAIGPSPLVQGVEALVFGSVEGGNSFRLIPF